MSTDQLLLVLAFVLFVFAAIAKFMGVERWTALGWAGLAAVTLASLT